MCGPSNIISDVGKGLGAIATGGTSLIPGSPTAKVGNAVGDVLTLGTAKLSMGGGGYTPTLLPQSDPVMQLAQSGGAPLLTSIALGANVNDAVAGYFGRASGQDFDAWFNGLTPDQQAAVKGVTNQLTQIQQNTDLRNQAVQKVVNDYPNLVQKTAQDVATAKQKAGEEFDAASKSYLDYANNAIAAKFGGTGTVSSGAAIAAANRAASELGIQKLGYQTEQGNTAFERDSADLLGAWSQQYTEANALRGFQQKMLGQGASQGFSAAQNAIKANADITAANTGAVNQANAAKSAADNALTSNLLGLGTTAGLLALTHGASAAAPKPPPTDNSTGFDPNTMSTPPPGSNYAPYGGVGPAGGYR